MVRNDSPISSSAMGVGICIEGRREPLGAGGELIGRNLLARGVAGNDLLSSEKWLRGETFGDKEFGVRGRLMAFQPGERDMCGEKVKSSCLAAGGL